MDFEVNCPWCQVDNCEHYFLGVDVTNRETLGGGAYDYFRGVWAEVFELDEREESESWEALMELLVGCLYDVEVDDWGGPGQSTGTLLFYAETPAKSAAARQKLADFLEAFRIKLT